MVNGQRTRPTISTVKKVLLALTAALLVATFSYCAATFFDTIKDEGKFGSLFTTVVNTLREIYVYIIVLTFVMFLTAIVSYAINDWTYEESAKIVYTGLIIFVTTIAIECWLIHDSTVNVYYQANDLCGHFNKTDINEVKTCDLYNSIFVPMYVLLILIFAAKLISFVGENIVFFVILKIQAGIKYFKN